MIRSRLAPDLPPSTMATIWRSSDFAAVIRLKPESRVYPVLMPSTPWTLPSSRLWLPMTRPRKAKERVWKYL